MLERIVILGAPAAGLALRSVAAIFLFQDITVLRNLAIAVLAVLLIPLLYFLVAVIPIPLVLYPRWAQVVVRDRRRVPPQTCTRRAGSRDQGPHQGGLDAADAAGELGIQPIGDRGQ